MAKRKKSDELIVANKELVFQNEEKEKRAAELSIADKELAFQNEEKEKRAAELSIANKELAFQKKEKGKRAAELIIANKELAYQNKEKGNREAELIIANKELAYQNKEKEKRAAELSIANKELAFQNKEKEKRAAELSIANIELTFQNEEKEKRAEELSIANIELAFQNEEKEKRTAEKEKRAAELIIANKELAFQNKEKEKRAAELGIANIELAFQNEEKEKRAEELIISTSTKITEGKKDEEYIGHLVAIVESSDDAIISLSLDGTIKSWNKSGEKMFGYTAEQAVGKHISLIIPPEYIKKEKKILERICNNEIIDHYETVRNKKNGKQFYVSLTVSPLKDRTGNIIGVSKIARDITSRKKSEAELIYANKELSFQNHEKEKRAAELNIANIELVFQNDEKEKRAAELSIANIELVFQNDEKEKRAAELSIAYIELAFQKKFLSIISHDLRNPLTALLISSDQLSRNTENHIFDGIQPLVKVIHRTSNKILQQLNELVDWAKMQLEKTTFNSEKLHLVHGVDQSLELLKANATQKNIVLENKVPFDIYVNADTLMLRSILQNLVTNAIKYTPQGGLITVTAQRIIDKMVEVGITDSGIGMEADIRDNLFTNSNFASVSGTNNEKGSGIGLILVKDFVTRHGGTIRVESEMGKGTCIIFTVPEY